MKFKNEPIFLIAALSLFFPIGLLFLFSSELSRSKKWVIGTCSLALFIGLLSLIFINLPQQHHPEEFNVVITRPKLSVGQSGGLAVTNGESYITDFSVQTDNGILDIHDSVYTAAAPGTCTLTVSFYEITHKIKITVLEGPSTESLVFASPTGERYHRNKEHGGKYAVSMTEEEALRSDKTPCKICYKK